VRVRSLLLLACGAAPLAAQDFAFKPRTQSEWSIEGVAARVPSAVVMIGRNVPIGYYVRAGIAAGGGVAWTHGAAGLTSRADLTARYLLDPFAESPRGFYLGGGLTATHGESGPTRVGLLAVVGVEGQQVHRGYRMAGEVALGEGTRLRVVFRRARINGR
jgi:hypothetical protein